MKIFDDTYQCDCGTQFKWKTFFLQPGEFVTFRLDDMMKNVVDKDIINQKYHITLRCPNCDRKHFLIK